MATPTGSLRGFWESVLSVCEKGAFVVLVVVRLSGVNGVGALIGCV